MSQVPGDFISKPYGVLREFTDPDGRRYPGKYIGSIDGNLMGIEAAYDIALKQILLASASNERSKEMGYIQQLMSKLFIDNKPNIYNEINDLLTAVITPKQGVSIGYVSKILDTLQKIQLGLYDVTKTIEENNEVMKAFNSIVLSEKLMSSIKDVFTDAPQTINGTKNVTVNSSGTDIINSIILETDSKIQKELNEIFKQNNISFTSKQQKVINNILTTYRSKLQQYYTNKFKSMQDAELLDKNLSELDNEIKNYDKTVKKKDKINGDSKPIKQFIYDLITGSLGGEALEISIDLAGGGVGTGRVLHNNRAIDADNILLATGNLEYSYPDLSKLIPDNNGNLVYNDLLNQLDNNQDLINGFVLMFSDKDQSTNATFNKYVATNTNVKLKDPGSLASRRGEIAEMFSAVGKSGSVEDLIFGLANLAQDFAYDGQVEQAKMVLGSLCVAWMFNDAVEIVQGGTIFQNTGATTLHFYNINGYYYTLSDILYKTAANLDDGISKGMSYVTINIGGLKSNPYEKMLELPEGKHPNRGIDEWDYVSNQLMKGITIGVKMNVKNLFNDLFSFK